MNKYQPLPGSPFDIPLIWFISGFYEFKGDFFSQEIDNVICFKGRWNSRYFQKSLTVHDLHLEFAPQATQGGIILNFNRWNVVIHVNILRKLAVYK